MEISLKTCEKVRLIFDFHGRKIGDEAKHMCHLAYCIPGVPKMFPYLSCYFIEVPPQENSQKDTMPKLDLRICFISVSARIDFL